MECCKIKGISINGNPLSLLFCPKGDSKQDRVPANYCHEQQEVGQSRRRHMLSAGAGAGTQGPTKVRRDVATLILMQYMATSKVKHYVAILRVRHNVATLILKIYVATTRMRLDVTILSENSIWK